jgi:hypothetical protein
MDRSHLVAAPNEIDGPRVLGFWSWLVDRPVTVVELTRFGDWFLADATGPVHRLDILEGTFAPVCDNVEEYHRRKNKQPERDDWFSEGMVESLHRHGLRPGPGQGFGYKGPPILGGSLERENIIVVELAGWQLFTSMLHQGLSKLPPGTHVTRLEMRPDGTFVLHTA